MLPDNQFDNVQSALQSAAARGFTFSFEIKNNKLEVEGLKETFSSTEVSIEEFHRIEGESDPDASAVVYLIETNSDIKGILVDAYGMYANADVAAFLKEVPIDRIETKNISAKKCLNCGTALTGRYCYVCGQKEVELHEPFWKLFAEAFADYWHFDSKAFRTIKYLLFKPGFLTNEFRAGRIATYVHPIRLYFFISVLFFVFFFGVAHNSLMDETNIQAHHDSAVAALKGTIDDSLAEKINHLEEEDNVQFSSAMLPKTVAAYEDSINRLPPANRPNWFRKFLDEEQIKINQKGSDAVLRDLEANVNRNLPKMMFVLLPVFALLLKLLYIRRKIYFIDHAVFSLHFHSFTFLLLLITGVITYFFPVIQFYGWPVLLLLLYLFLAMRKVYKQPRGKTWLKFLLLLFSYGIMILVFLSLTFMISLLETA